MEQRDPLARVHDIYLYKDEVESVMPTDIHGEDSLLWVRQYVDQWARGQILMAKASFNLGDEVEEIEKLVSDYREDLIKFRYQEAMVNKYLDTTLTEDQIKTYFEENSFNFELKENIVRASYLITVPDAPKLDEAKRLLKSEKAEDLIALEDYALQYARSYSLRDSNWISFNELSRLVPIQTYNQQEFLVRNSFVEIEDSTSLYLLKIWDYKIRDGMSPLPYVKSTIKSIILNQRRRSLLDELEQELVDEAIQKDHYEFYD
jgi:hypothetical protein